MKRQKRHDVNAKVPTFIIGDLVLLKFTVVQESLSRKLVDKFKGPYYIVELGPNHTYKLKNHETNKIGDSLKMQTD